MFFNEFMTEDETDLESKEIDAILPQDPETEEGIDNLADQVEDAMQSQALECADYFEGGEEAIKEFAESPEVQASINEAFSITGKDKKRTLVRLGRKDDLKRRANLAALLIAKSKGDPLFKKMAKHRHEERQCRKQIFNKYQKQAMKIARRSQIKHMQERKKFRLPFFGKKDDAKK